MMTGGLYSLRGTPKHVEAGHRTATFVNYVILDRIEGTIMGSRKKNFVGDKEANKLTDRKRENGTGCNPYFIKLKVLALIIRLFYKRIKYIT